MNSEAVQIKCKGCATLFPINTIRTHLGHPVNLSCKEEYSKEEYRELKRLYESYRKKKRAENYRKNKKKPKEVKFMELSIA